MVTGGTGRKYCNIRYWTDEIYDLILGLHRPLLNINKKKTNIYYLLTEFAFRTVRY